MKYIVLLMPVLLVGCFHQTVNLNDIQTAIKVCGSLENVVGIEATFIGSEYALCSDRSFTMLDQRVGSKK